jgi:hypothetical protein
MMVDIDPVGLCGFGGLRRGAPRFTEPDGGQSRRARDKTAPAQSRAR